jgi:hypothetical protein
MLSNMVSNDPFLPPVEGIGSKPRWTEHEIGVLNQWYSTIPNEFLARKLHRTVKSVVAKAFSMGLKKTPERIAQMGRENVAIRWDRKDALDGPRE